MQRAAKSAARFAIKSSAGILPAVAKPFLASQPPRERWRYLASTRHRRKLTDVITFSHTACNSAEEA